MLDEDAMDLCDRDDADMSGTPSISPGREPGEKDVSIGEHGTGSSPQHPGHEFLSSNVLYIIFAGKIGCIRNNWMFYNLLYSSVFFFANVLITVAVLVAVLLSQILL